MNRKKTPGARSASFAEGARRSTESLRRLTGVPLSLFIDDQFVITTTCLDSNSFKFIQAQLCGEHLEEVTVPSANAQWRVLPCWDRD